MITGGTGTALLRLTFNLHLNSLEVPMRVRAHSARVIAGGGAIAFLCALAPAAANAQAVISRSISAEPVETIVTQTPTGTVVTRRPVDGVVQHSAAAPVVVETVPNTIDAITTREVVQRRAATEASRLVTREVAAWPAKQATIKRTTTTRRTTRTAAPRLALNPQERQIVYRTIVEREVVPARPTVVPQTYATQQVVVPVPVQAPIVQAPIVAATEIDDEPIYRVGAVLPANVPLYAMPQNVALTVPATRPYSYAWLGGRAYVVDPVSGVVMADLTE
jgi:hypothetical protein